MYFSAAGVAAVAMVVMIGSVLLGPVHATECKGSAVFPRIIGLDTDITSMTVYEDTPEIFVTTINQIDYGFEKAMLIAVGRI